MKICDLSLHDVLLPDGRRADITFDNGHVVHTGAALRSAETIHTHGLLLLPAATDMHVHMRGGTSQFLKEDWRTGTMGAIAGGVTFVVDQPNTVPPLISAGNFIDRVREAKSDAQCHFAINAGLENGTDLKSLWNAGAMAFGELFHAPSSYGGQLTREELSAGFKTISGFNGLATLHSETVRGEEPADLAGHDSNRSPEGESEAVHEIIRLNTSRCRLHFCHLSCSGAFNEVRKGKAAYDPVLTGKKCLNMNDTRISVEVTPHHLLLSYQDFSPLDTHAKVNPPLRTEKERQELWAMWDRIDVIASDHAPHTCNDKSILFPDAPSGIPGVETMVPLLLPEIKQRGLSLTSFIDKICLRPCSILGIPAAGSKPGERADFALYPGETIPVDPDSLHGKSGWTPFEGRPALFPEIVVMGGRVVYHSGEFFRGLPSWYPGRGYPVDTDMVTGDKYREDR